MPPRLTAFRPLLLTAVLVTARLGAQTAAPANGLPPPPPPPDFGPKKATPAPVPPTAPKPPVQNPAVAIPNVAPKATPVAPVAPVAPVVPVVPVVPVAPVAPTAPVVPNAPVAPPPVTEAQPPPPPPPPVEPQPGPWKILFDGKTVNGLKGVQKSDFLKGGWKIADGALTLSKDIKSSGKITGGHITTTDTFTDFEFCFEWRLLVSGKSGVAYFGSAGSGTSPSGHLFQIIDDRHNPDSFKGGPIKSSGALYGVLAPNESKRLNDDWNTGRLIVQGKHVEHWINDAKVLEYEIGSNELKKAVQTHKAKVGSSFGQKVKTPITLLDAGEDVYFKNLKVRVLPPK